MLKRYSIQFGGQVIGPAAFGRLCVETSRQILNLSARLPAAFGRLCVETVNMA